MSLHLPPRVDPPPPAPLRALSYQAGDAAVIAAEGWLDAASGPILARVMADALARGERNLVLDMHQLRGLDSHGLAVLWATLRAVLRRGGRLTVAGLRPSLQDALDPLAPHGLRQHCTVRAAISAPLQR